MATPIVPPALQTALTPQLFQQAAGKGGRLSAEEAQKFGIPPPPKGYQYTYDFNKPGAPIGLKKDSSILKNVGKAAIIGGGALATAMTGGAASPLLAAGIGAATGAGTGALDGGWKGALLGGITGAAGGGLMPGGLPKLPNGGVIMNATAGAGSKMATPSWLTDLLKNPQTYGSILNLLGRGGGGTSGPGGTIAGGTGGTPNPYAMSATGGGAGSVGPLGATGGILAGAAGGLAQERQNENTYGINLNNTGTSRYGIEQGAVSNLLAQQEKGAMDRAALGIAAPGARAGQVVRGSLIANVQDAKISHPRATIPTISGGLKPSALSPMARQAGHELQNQAYDALVNKSDIPAPTDFMGQGRVKPPDVEEYKEPGTMENVATGSSLVANILEQLMRAGRGGGMQQQEEQPVATPPITPPPPSGRVPGVGPGEQFPGWVYQR